MACLKDIAEFVDSIVWCDQSYSLKDFVVKYPPPQLVRVDDGFYGSEDEETLSQGQIISLHTVRRTDKVRVAVAMKEGEEKTVFIPLNCPEKVEIVPKGCRDRYSSLGCLLRDSPTFVRAVHDTPWLNLKARDVLKLQDVVRDGRTTRLVFEPCDKTRGLVRIPVDYEIAFEALAFANAFFLKEIVELFVLPVRLRFTKHGTDVDGLSDATGLKTLDAVLLEELCEEESVISTSRDENVTTVLNIPVDLDVTITAALGAVFGNKEYTRFCKTLHDEAELEKGVDWNHVRGDKLVVKKIAEYEEIAPLCPPRRPPKPASIPRAETSSNAVKKEKAIKKSSNDQREGEDSHLKLSHVSLEPSDIIQPCSKVREVPEGQDIYQDFDTRTDKEEEKNAKEEVEDTPIAPERTTSLREPVVADEQSSIRSHSDCRREACYYYPHGDRALQQPSDGVAFPSLTSKALEWPVCSQTDAESGALAVAGTASCYPQDVRELSVQELGEWLQKLKMKQYIKKFAKENIDGAMLCHLNRADMKRLGVKKELHQTKLSHFARGWKPANLK